jgi:hypothetical protein
LFAYCRSMIETKSNTTEEFRNSQYKVQLSARPLTIFSVVSNSHFGDSLPIPCCLNPYYTLLHPTS